MIFCADGSRHIIEMSNGIKLILLNSSATGLDTVTSIEEIIDWKVGDIYSFGSITGIPGSDENGKYTDYSVPPLVLTPSVDFIFQSGVLMTAAEELIAYQTFDAEKTVLAGQTSLIKLGANRFIRIRNNDGT
jgi:hypothetical protein